ncbi:MAG: Rrf2 family transcriptional regulator [Fibrobacter sp.]|nr:Rrf2 family transcriptional regulator [Fibrobacter sp.]
MKISTRGQYSLEALLCLATATSEKPYSIHTIAEKTHISDGYLEQLFIPLKKAGYVSGSRGVQGGYRLAKDPKEIVAYQVLDLMETSLHTIPCLNGEECTKSNICESKVVWTDVESSIEKVMRSVTLADLMETYNSFQGDSAE